MGADEEPLTCGPQETHEICTGGETCIALRSSIRLDTLVFDELELGNFFRSIGRTVVLERHTHRRSQGLIISVDVEQDGSIQDEVKAEVALLERDFVAALGHGASEVVRYLNELEVRRDSARAAIEQRYAEAGRDNENRRTVARVAVVGLAVVKASATILMKGASLKKTRLPTPVFLIGTGYDMALELVKDWGKAPEAVLVGIASTGGKKLAKKALTTGAHNAAEMIEGEASNARHQIGWLPRAIEKKEEELARRFSQEKFDKIAKMKRKLAGAEHTDVLAKRTVRGLRTVEYGIKYGSFVWDVFSALKEVRDIYRESK
jgi:hypothetical protein